MTGAQTTSLYRHSPLRAIAEARAGDLVIATPFIWAKLVQSGLRFAPGVAGVTSAGPSDTATWSAPGRTGLDTLTEIYGATETGGIGYRHAMQDHFTLLPHLTQTDAGVASIDNANEVHTVQDRLSWIDDRRFDILGRLDDVIQIAGVNVSPHHICQTIKAVDGVAEADVRFDGQKLRARVVPESANDNADDILARIRTHLNQQLDPPGRPSQIAICAALPRNAMGKCVDHP